MAHAHLLNLRKCSSSISRATTFLWKIYDVQVGTPQARHSETKGVNLEPLPQRLLNCLLHAPKPICSIWSLQRAEVLLSTAQLQGKRLAHTRSNENRCSCSCHRCLSQQRSQQLSPCGNASEDDTSRKTIQELPDALNVTDSIQLASDIAQCPGNTTTDWSSTASLGSALGRYLWRLYER